MIAQQAGLENFGNLSTAAPVCQLIGGVYLEAVQNAIEAK